MNNSGNSPTLLRSYFLLVNSPNFAIFAKYFSLLKESVQMPRITLFDAEGNRKYLTPTERERFYDATGAVTKDWRMFSLMLYATGCRLSEALNIKIKDIDFTAKAVTIGTLKQRQDGIYRQVPLSDEYLRALDNSFDLRIKQKKNSKIRDTLIWDWSRRHGYQVIKRVMEEAELEGAYAMPKGLRHAFAIACIDKGIPLNMVQKWLGHSSIETTAIYANAIGREERKLAARLWGTD
jgi:integrase